MNRYKLLLVTLVLVGIISCQKETTTIPGVDQQMAEDRKSRISDIHYSLRFTIPEDKASSINALIEISFSFSGNGDVQLDFKEEQDHLIETSVNDQVIAATIENEHIVIPSDKLVEGENTVSIDFIAGDLSLNRNEEYLYTLLVPARARTVFPVFDQPDMKATYTLELIIPEEWEAVANGPVDTDKIESGKRIINYKETKPISTYLFAFAAGKFKKWADEATGMTMYYRETDSIKVARNAPEIFQLHQSSLEWLEEYTGILYPFQKFDFALIPTFQYGGMEHPGAIFYRERSLMLDDSASVNQKLRRASLIAHETAHMWFGDLVTMKWFDDVWLKEVFANFMAAKMVNPNFPEVNHDLRFLLAHYPRAYGVDRTDGSHPIQQPLPNLEDAGSVYGAIIYQKAPIVMRNLETYLGEDQFRSGIKDYLNKYSLGNATWDNLIEIMAGLTEQDLNQWNNDWVKRGQMPVLTSSLIENRITTTLENGENNRVWPQNITYRIIGQGVDLTFPSNTGDLSKGVIIDHDVNKAIPNPDGLMYGYHQLNNDQKQFMLSSMGGLEDPVERASYWLMLWESFLNNNLSTDEMMLALKDHVVKEKNPLILSYISGILQSLYWHYYTQDERVNISPELEDEIFSRVMNEADISLKRTLFNLYQSIVLSTGGVDNLKLIWNKELKAFDLPLSDRDYEGMAYELALRLPDESETIMNTQIKRLNNPDSKDRMKFIQPALSPNPSDRDAFYESLKDPDNRSIEPWVNQALSFLHHPMRVDHSLKYIYPSLEMIEEIQQTGDIFFPKGWLDNTLGGHSSSEAVSEVRKFINENPNLPDHLKNKILQSADLLFRVSLKG
ncbi:MAG: peptidase M1 [Saprospiraceae bacterium]|nr:peptidase M1 [Saprospiraceae bacterium]